jgi:hypothetical protein
MKDAAREVEAAGGFGNGKLNLPKHSANPGKADQRAEVLHSDRAEQARLP